MSADHLVPCVDQLRDEPGSDRPAGSCHEDSHRALPSVLSRGQELAVGALARQRPRLSVWSRARPCDVAGRQCMTRGHCHLANTALGTRGSRRASAPLGHARTGAMLTKRGRTALLMTRLYHEMLGSELRPPEALRRAKLWLRDLSEE